MPSRQVVCGVTSDGQTEVPLLVDASGALATTGGGGGGGGDASAANQTAGNAILTTIDTAVDAANVTLTALDAAVDAMSAKLPAALGTQTAANSLSVAPATGAITDISGTVTTGGTAQQLAAANSARRGLTLQNTSAGNLRVNPWGTASATAGIRVTPDALLVLDAPHCGVGAISIWGATTAQAFAGGEAV